MDDSDTSSDGYSDLTHALYFVTIGWWLGTLWLAVALLLMLTFIGWPLAYKMFDSVKYVFTLKS